MVRTRSYETLTEAIEAWSTWAGSTRPASREEYNQLNDGLERDYPIEEGKVRLPEGEEAFGDLVIADPGGYESPWPRIYLSDYSHVAAGLYGGDSMKHVYKLRARWRLIDKNHPRLKARIVEMIALNDRESVRLNHTLQEWNRILEGSDFPLFGHNDLRGVDLSGQSISGATRGPVYLRRANLRYAECHLLRIENANLYRADLTGVKGVQMDISQATAHGIRLRVAYLSQSCFVAADLGSADCRHVFAPLANFDGANCSRADFSGAFLRRASFGVCAGSDHAGSGRLYSDLSAARWDDRTVLSEVRTNELLQEQNRQLHDRILSVREGRSLARDVLSSLEVKPGLFGVSIDIRRLAKPLLGFLPWLRSKR